MKIDKIKLIKPNLEMSSDEIAKIAISNYEKLKEAYPEDIPNNLCNTAILSGILYSSEESLRIGFFERLLSTQNEDVYLWKSDDAHINFVSIVKSEVLNLDIWKTCGLMISLSFAMTKGFEHSTDDVVYNWVYRFDKNQSKKDLDFYFSDSSFEINNGIFINNHDLRTMIPYIALLSINDVFLNAVMNFNSSMQLSYTCLFCELSEKENKMHPSHEPKVWEKLALYSNYETAIVLACRSVENILGKPPKKDKVGSVEKFKTKWLTMLNLDPDDHFKKGNCTYFDFYYRLFIMRNDSAHANYKRTFDLERKNTIESQCFAALILSDYALKNIQNFQDSCHSLNVNTKIIK